MSAQWAGPTATAPANNASAPINISSNYQAKLGDLGAVRVRAGQYCNAAGTVCFIAEDIYKNMFTVMRNLGLPVPTAPAGLPHNEWPTSIVCTYGSDRHLLTASRVDVINAVKEVEYRDETGKTYEFELNGAYKSRAAVSANCSDPSTGPGIVSICNAGLCIY